MMKTRNFNPKINPTIVLLSICTLVYILVYWHRLLLQSMIPFDGNMIRLFYPSWMVGKKLLLEGCYFLWDPYRNMGQPFLADPQNQALYPLRILSPLVHFLDYQRISIVFHILLASTTGYLLGKRIFKEKMAGLFVGLALGFNGFFLARVTLSSHFATMAWIPALLLLLDQKKTIFLGVVLTLQWFAGFPPFFIITFLVLGVFSSTTNQPKASLICLLKGYLIMLGLSAIQYIPFMEMLNESHRSLLLSGGEATVYSLHPLEFIRQLLIPSVLLTPLEPISNSDPGIITFYYGPFLFILFLWGVIKGRKKEKILGAVVAFSFLLALGKYNGFYEFIPMVTLFRFPSNWILLSIIPLVFVSTYGLLKIRNIKLRKGIFAVIALDLLLYALPMHTPWGDLTFISKAPLRIRGLEQIPTESRLFHSPLITNQLHNWGIKSKDKWLLMKGILSPSVGVAYGLKEVSSYHVLTSQRHWNFLSRLAALPVSSPLFDFAGVSKIITLKNGTPRTTVLRGTINGPASPSATPGHLSGFRGSILAKPNLQSFPDLHPGSQVKTDEKRVKLMSKWDDFVVKDNHNFKSKAFVMGGKEAKVLENAPGHLKVSAEGPGQLVVSEAFYPGWRVWIDGKKAFLEPFEDEFLSVKLNEGRHRIRFHYRPLSFFVGGVLSLLTVFIIIFRKFISLRKEKGGFRW